MLHPRSRTDCLIECSIGFVTEPTGQMTHVSSVKRRLKWRPMIGLRIAKYGARHDAAGRD
jgi:hypothetical protein